MNETTEMTDVEVQTLTAKIMNEKITDEQIVFAIYMLHNVLLGSSDIPGVSGLLSDAILSAIQHAYDINIDGWPHADIVDSMVCTLSCQRALLTEDTSIPFPRPKEE